MDLQILITFILAASIVPGLTRKYMRIGLVIAGLGLITQTIFSYITNDLFMATWYAIASAGMIYELIKSLRDKDYHLTRKARLTTSIAFIILGGFYMIILGVPFYLIASILVTILILFERKETEPKN